MTARSFLFVGALLAACGGKILEEPAPVEPLGIAPARTEPSPPPIVDAGPEADAKPKPPPHPVRPQSAETVDLGTQRTGEPFRFDVPPNVLGFQLVLQAYDDFEEIVLDALTSPSGQRLFSAGMPLGSEVPTAAGFGMASAAIPQPDVYRDGPVEPGEWTGVAGGSGPKPIKVKLVLQRTSDGLFHGGELDLHVHVPKGLVLSQPGARHEVTIDGAPDDVALRARIDLFYELLDELVGISRGDVSYHPMPARFAAIGWDEEKLVEAFEATRTAPPGQALHVIFTNDLGPALGIAPAIPGDGTQPGTALSAIAVTQYENSPPELDAYTMMHELGHFVGLSHTTEFSFEDDVVVYSDPLPDTPVCDGGVTESNVLSCADIENLMFPSAAQGEVGLLSISQVRVFRGSSAYRARQTGAVVPPPLKPLPKRISPDVQREVLRRCRFPHPIRR